MNSLIDRYVYDVTRRLPEKERAEIGRELKSNILEMLRENPDEGEIKEALAQLGSPAALAEQYRRESRYLISPAYYDGYIRALKHVLPLVSCLMFILGLVLEAVDGIGNAAQTLPRLTEDILARGLSMGISAAFQTLVWITLGVAITERIASRSKGKEWSPSDLPDEICDPKVKIALSDTLVELGLTLFFSAMAILIGMGVIPISFVLRDGVRQAYPLFSAEFSAACIHAVAVIAFSGICQCAVKLKKRRWTPLVCGTVLVGNIIGIALTLYLVSRPDVLSAEFTAFLQGIGPDSSAVLQFMKEKGIRLIIRFIAVIVVIAFVWECGIGVWRLNQNRSALKDS